MCLEKFLKLCYFIYIKHLIRSYRKIEFNTKQQHLYSFIFYHDLFVTEIE